MHPSRIVASGESLTLIVRDHDDDQFERHTELVLRLAQEIETRARARVTVDTVTSTETCVRRSNSIRSIVSNAEEAIRRAGVEPVRSIAVAQTGLA